MFLAVAVAGLAGLLALRAPGARVLHRRLAGDAAPSGSGVATGTKRRYATRLAGFGAAAGIPTAAALSAGMRGLALALPVVLVSGTILILARRATRRRHSARQRQAVSHACTMLAGQMGAGQIPLDALRSVAQDCPILVPAASTADLGGDIVTQWRRQAARPGQAGLADLARAWQLSVNTGAPMADVLDDVARALSDDEALDLVIASEAAGPRASGKIMAVLPLVAMSMGYLLGGDPVGFLFGSPLGWASLSCGVSFACGGVLWMDRVADHAAAGA